MELFSQKLDAKNFVVNQGLTNALSCLMLKPYQIKLLSTFANGSKLESVSSEQKQQPEIEEAISQLRATPETSESKSLSGKIDDLLKEKVNQGLGPKQNHQTASSKNPKSAVHQTLPPKGGPHLQLDSQSTVIS